MKLSTSFESKPYIELLRGEVVHRALRIWQTAGRPAGRDLEFWLQAEVELVSEQQHYRSNQAGLGDFN